MDEYRCPCHEAPPLPMAEARWTVCPACGDRGYQGMIVRGVYRRIAEGYSRILVAMGTGLGKTRTLRRIIQQAVAKALRLANGGSREKTPRRVMFVVHREELVIQTAAELAGVTPDEAIERLEGGVLQMGYGCEHAGIGVVKAGHRERKDALIQIVSPKSIPGRIWVIDEWLEMGESLVVVDEAHTVAYYEEVFPLLQNLIPGTVAILLTATPARSDDRLLSEVADVVVAGPLPRDAQDAGFLARFRYRSVTTRQKVNTQQDSRALLDAYLAEARDRQGIVFCANVKHARAMAKAFVAAGVEAVCIDGSVPPKKREPIYRRFRQGDIQIVTCDDILTAGVDFPFVSYIGLLGYVGAWATFIQVIGRGSRPSSGKVDCLVHDAGRNVETHGGLEDVRAEDYAIDGRAGKHDARVRKQCPRCRAIIPFPAASCSCGHRWPAALVPVLDLSRRPFYPRAPSDVSPEWWVNARRVYGNCLSKAMREGHSPSTAMRKAEFVLEVEGLDIDTRHTLFWPPTEQDLARYAAYLFSVAAKPNRKGNERRDDAWIRHHLAMEFGDLVIYKGEALAA